MALCENCGSIQVVRTKSTAIDRAVRLLSGRKPFVCRRCGWRARRRWDESNPSRYLEPTVWAANDPELVALDEVAPGSEIPPHQSMGGGSDTVAVLRQGPRKKRGHKRAARTSRHEILGAVALTGVVMFAVAMFGLIGSCSGAGG